MSDVRNFGAAGDGVRDDTESVRHAVAQGDGTLAFPPGRYLLTGTVEIPLGDRGPAAIIGSGGTATIVMASPGPAFRLKGNHRGTGNPRTVNDRIWARERMPALRAVAVEGAHAEADGFELVGTMQPVFDAVAVRRCRHGIRLTGRNRNVLISNCHLYHNTGVGLFLDGVNLHQINVTGSHISYNRLGGIRIERSEIRNLQITGNDIEYNNAVDHPGLESEPTAEIWIDTTAEGASVNEVAIASNTIQATASEGGANLRIMENPGTGRTPGLITVSGNVIGSQQNNVHLTGCYGIAITGNTIYSAAGRNLLAERCRALTVGSNHFRRHTPEFGTGVRLVDCVDSTFTGCTLHDASEAGQASGASLLELIRCRRVNVSGCVLTGGAPYGVDAQDCVDLSITGCTVAEGDDRPEPRAKGALRFTGKGSGNQLALNTLRGGVEIGEEAGVGE